MPKGIQGNPENNDGSEQNIPHNISKELRKLLLKRPEIQQWREDIIAEQRKNGEQAKQKYASLSTPENLSRFFAALPHSITGWMIRTLSPEDSLLQIQPRTSEQEQRPHVIIDPYRI